MRTSILASAYAIGIAINPELPMITIPLASSIFVGISILFAIVADIFEFIQSNY